jgi:hypothetical protein
MIRALLLCLLLSSCGESSPIGSAVAQQSFGERISFELVQAKENNPAGLMRNPAHAECAWPGSGATGNDSVWFAEQHRRIRYAWWIATLIPNGGGVRLVAYDYDQAGAVRLTVLGEYRSAEVSPVPRGAWVQDGLNQLIIESSPQRPYRYIGVQVCGDARLYTSSVYVVTE